MSRNTHPSPTAANDPVSVRTLGAPTRKEIEALAEIFDQYRAHYVFAITIEVPASLRLAHFWQIRDLFVLPTHRRLGVAAQHTRSYCGDERGVREGPA